jgi:hypothetical protein
LIAGLIAEQKQLAVHHHTKKREPVDFKLTAKPVVSLLQMIHREQQKKYEQGDIDLTKEESKICSKACSKFQEK